ncbi:flagellin [Fuerstiella marisgermanici]|uniref:Flagellin n=1 Tax=Fuerstiella marisgermanici TaxID=1891926 RepID=A0A1P8WHZ3_9PLAN|nr:flagellin [Fuerstiella marisgermanici]APZ93684.1 Phase 1-I flagellin [Fuerstiella marisgermanici]
MALGITNNVSSLTAQHNLGKASRGVAQSVERLSSGLKVNRGADGPAALVISEKQRAQIAGLNAAIDNSEKAVSLVQTAEGALSEINSLLVKVRSLAIDSANTGVNDEDALAANQSEIDNALDTINRIANNTQFGTKKLLDGSAGVKATSTDSAVTFLKGTSDTTAGTYTTTVTTAAERANVSATAQTTTLNTDETLTVNDVEITLTAGLTQNQVVDRINEFTTQTGVKAEINGTTTRLYTEDFGSDAEISAISNVAASGSSSGIGTSALTDDGVDIVGTIGGTSFNGSGNLLTADSGAAKGLSIQTAASATDATSTGTTVASTLSVTDNSLQFQIGPNQNQTANISIDRINPVALGFGVGGNQFNNLNEIDVTSAGRSQDSLAVIDAAIDDVTNLRGTLGAFQANTLESTANNLRATLENTVNAESVIRDTDFAEEIANFTKGQVLVQAGTSVLGNANQIPQQVLSLLG